MNEELAVKLSDLRAAAEAMQRGTATIRVSVEAARSEISALAAQIDPAATPSFGALAYSGRLLELTDTLDRLSAQLSRTADDVDYAARWQGPPLGVLWDRIRTRPRADISPADASGPIIPSYTLGSYISRANRPLYDALLADRAALESERASIQRLSAVRADAAGEAAALHDRLLAYGEANIAAVPRVQTLNAQIAAYDQEIRAAEVRAANLESRIDAATARLIAVNPADNADVYLIRTLEGSESAPYVLNNTRDCVNYIASRVPIPGELAANAHLWDERAAEFPQFGIRTGDAPKPGAILVMEADHPYADDRYGHVMLVERVDSSGGVWVTDNNHAQPVRLNDLTTETTGARVKYLYLPWFTQA
jgi:surface antigen